MIAFHYINNQLIYTKSTIGHFFYQITGFGWVGVDLFFVISGFLIGRILLEYKRTTLFFKAFYIRRFLRIVPVYYLLIFVFILIVNSDRFSDDVFLTGNNVIPTWSYFAMVHNFYMAAMESMGNKAMSVTWSIGIEEQFYLLFPLLLLFIKEKWLPCFLILSIVATVFFRSLYSNWIPAYVLLPCRMDAISFGILIAWIHKNYPLEIVVRKYKNFLLASAGLAVMICAVLFFLYKDMGIMRNSLIAFIFSCLIVLAIGMPTSGYSRFLGNSFLSWIAKLSYSLYLFHCLFLALARYTGGYFGDIRETSLAITISATALTASVLFSAALYKYIEQPMARFGKKYSYAS